MFQPSLRKHNFHYLSARDLARCPSLSWQSAWGQREAISSEAKMYAYGVHGSLGHDSVGVLDRVIVRRHKETDELRLIPYFTRFSDDYYRGAIKKLKRLRAQDAVFLTLTVDPSYFTSLAHARRGLAKGFNNLMSMLRKRYGTLAYLSVVEFTVQGVPHVHALILDRARLIDANELREFWNEKYHVGKIVHIKKIKNDGAQVVGYLCKYMAKSLTMPDIEFKGADGLTDAKPWYNLALSWSLNLRAYSCSRGILDSPMNISNSFWEFLGSFPAIDVDHWADKKFSDVQAEFYDLTGGGGDLGWGQL